MLDLMSRAAIGAAERGLLPDALLRAGIRTLLKGRLSSLPSGDSSSPGAYLQDFANQMHVDPVAKHPDLANDQHYELPPRFFELVLGKHRKYSCGWWPKGTRDLDASEDIALAETCKRAGLEDGMNILELGCGWGSLSLWMAAHYPNATITVISNSGSQGEYIRQQARERDYRNLRVVTADMNDLVTQTDGLLQRSLGQGQFDRIVSVEMFEHMSNWPALFARVQRWLKPGGRFFMHVFCHRHTPYHFTVERDDDWMAKYFFSGGIMPSDTLAPYIAARLQGIRFNKQWRWYGGHYAKTSEAWLTNMSLHRDEIMAIFRETYGEDQRIWWNRWRLFFLACAELFAWNEGREWWVSHYLFEREAEHGQEQQTPSMDNNEPPAPEAA